MRRDHSRPYRPASIVVVTVLRWVVLPLVAAAFAALSARDVPHAYRAAHGGGIRGTYVVTERSCGRSCSVTGTFTAHDGSVRRTGVGFPEGGGLREGETAEVAYAGGLAYKPDGHEWVLTALVTAACTVGVVVWLVLVVRALRERRAERREGLLRGPPTVGASHVRVLDRES